MIWFLKRSNEAPWYGLVGTFDKASTQSFAPLEYYDEKNAFTIDIHDKDKAELYLYANDKEGRYFNNQGKLKFKNYAPKNSPNKKDQH